MRAEFLNLKSKLFRAERAGRKIQTAKMKTTAVIIIKVFGKVSKSLWCSHRQKSLRIELIHQNQRIFEIPSYW